MNPALSDNCPTFSYSRPCEPQWMSPSSLLTVVFVVLPPAGDFSPRTRRGGGSCTGLEPRGSGSGPSFRGGRNSFPLSVLTILCFGGKSTKDACLTQLEFLCGTPSLRKVSPACTLMHHVHPVLIDFQCAFWRGLQPSAGSWGTKGARRSPPLTTSEG